ncbi:hypothetical protein [Pelotomaculum isophthalicicum]|nr:hypothetical protein [Pelotomaculum isophthalicicum]
MAKRQTKPAQERTTAPIGNGSIIARKGVCAKKAKEESLKNKTAE